MNDRVRIAQSAEDLRRFLEKTVARSAFKLRRIRLSEQNHWAIEHGALSHFSSGFFHVAGISNRFTREEHLILFQPQSALAGLALFRDGRQVYVLVQARIEPGLGNIGQYGPTIQSTSANYLQKHGGKSTSYADLFRGFNPMANALGNNMQPDLGKRYFQKNKVHSYLELDEQIETLENMIWVPLPVIAEVLISDNFLNPDLRSLLTVFDWDLFANGNVSCCREAQGSENDSFTLPANLLGNNEWKLIALDQLTGWETEDWGVKDVSSSGIWVDMFHVSTFSREVQEWSQPLLSCANQGLVVLLVRRVNDHDEFLISIEPEYGLSGELGVLPSVVIYPGDNHENVDRLFADATLLAEMKLSEEGGRFFRNESLYQVVLTEDDVEIAPHQRWVTAGTLKSIMRSSNRATIQLRCAASMVLDRLNPGSFKMAVGVTADS